MPIYLLGLIQAISEFLPISSSGHLNLFQQKPSITLDIFLHLATLFSVLFFFRKSFSFFLKNISFIFVATLPVAIIGFIFKSSFDGLFQKPQLLPFFFLITTLILFSTKFLKLKNQTLTYQKALIIGFFQSAALFPGVSRSAATLFAGLFVGLSATTAFKFSFSLFIPATLGAIILATPDLTQLNFNIHYLFSFIVTFLVGLLALKILKNVLSQHKLWLFSIYTLILSLLLFTVSWRHWGAGIAVFDPLSSQTHPVILTAAQNKSKKSPN